ncbi:D-alanyl-D-alanine dipeptidase [Aquicella siphonis]|uniref:D-alanyl-D-alanine dipeptidase n=1 Tax=Aquicella siphonis TaxID=254247 RepID=A0A5E4PFB1_9COXI|nr:M15 family metallopeptidase [Aquicella siphonis]VVC75669.1 D-alanyl-D-alanine dipeptidase [Aquicella siphonis]
MQVVDFPLISDPKVWAMRVQECHECLVDLKDLGFNISLARASYYDGYTKVRQTVADKLVQAQALLPQGMVFLFSEGHRPVSLQREMYQEYYSVLAAANPEWDEEILKQETVKFVAPPQDVPPHSTGGAIDITLLDAEGREVDMGGILDETPDKNEYRNFTAATNISSQAKANRQILINVLSQAGFVNYPAEWWHWSYGDKYWAYHARRPYAIYGSV